MKTVQMHIVFLAAGLVILSGCAAAPVKNAQPVCATGIGREKAVRAAEDVLTAMHFQIDKADANAGIVRTRPIAGAQFFEFWRDDSVGPFNWAESNLHSVRKVVQVNVRQKDGGVCIDCNVAVQRLAIPEQPVSSVSRAYRMYTESKRGQQRFELSERQEKQMAWIDLGSDGMLAEKILMRIEKRIDSLEKG